MSTAKEMQGEMSAAARRGIGRATPWENGARAGSQTEPTLDDAQINRQLAVFQDGLRDWTRSIRGTTIDFAAVIRRIRTWAVDLWNTFLHASSAERTVETPEFQLSLSGRSGRVLGHYVPGRNGAGLRFEVNINPRYLFSMSELKVAAVLLHELMHCLEDITQVSARSAGHNNYHTKWFRDFTGRLGIPCSKWGHFGGVESDSPFARWAVAHQLEGSPLIVLRPAEPAVSPCGNAPRRATWICECTPEERVLVLVARGQVLRARCEGCGHLYRRR